MPCVVFGEANLHKANIDEDPDKIGTAMIKVAST
jgi:hypothetical protein